MLNGECRGRLENWKFVQAARYLDEQATCNERETVLALSATFGNSGWFSGALGEVVRAAVQRLLDGYPDEEDAEA